MSRAKLQRITYSEILRQVSFRTYLPSETVRLVLDNALIVMGEALQGRFQVTLGHFGTIYPHVRRTALGTLGLAVSLTIKPAQALKESLRKALLS